MTQNNAAAEHKPIASLTDEEFAAEKEAVKIESAIHQKKFTLAQLLKVEFPPLIWYIDGILTTGLTLLWGAVKGGKSILVLHLLLAVSCGGRALVQLGVKKAAVMLISLEDGPRRLQTRFKNAEAVPDEEFYIFTDWPRASAGIENLKAYLDDHPEIKIICIDTLFLFAKISDGNDYSETTGTMEQLKRIADDRDICIICVHHSRKVGRDNDGDMVETALGSTGIVSGPDHLLYLKRTPTGPSNAVLCFRSKDADSSEMALNFDQDIGGWKYVGEARELAATNERQEVLEILYNYGKPLKTGQIAKELGKKTYAVSYLLKQLEKEGKVCSPGYGQWITLEPDTPPLSTQSTQSNNNIVEFGDLAGGIEDDTLPF